MTRITALEGIQRMMQSLEQAGLRAGQKAVMQDLESFFMRNEKGYVAMPTGSGKTVLFATLLASQELTSLVVVPTKQLMSQTLAELTARGVENVVATNDLRNRYTKQSDMQASVVVTTYAQLVRASRNPWGRSIIDPQDFGMVILDEAHHAMAEGATHALHRFNHAFQLGFTASPNYSEARVLREKLPTVIHELTIQEAISLGLIVPYTNVLLLTDTDMSSVPVIRNEFDARLLDGAVNSPERNHAIANFFATNLAEKKAIVSCSSIAHAQAMSHALQRQGVSAAAVHGTMPKQEITAILDKFKVGEITALCNNKLLTEGFDDTGIEVVLNASPTLSVVRQQQRTGRGLRVDLNNPNKELLIIDCLDQNYRARPVLFMDEAIAGAVSVPGTSELSAQLSAISSEQGSTLLLTQPDEITDYLSTLTPLAYKSKPRQESETPSSNPGGLVAFHEFTIINGVLQRTTPRRYELGSGSTLFREEGLCAQTDPEAFFPEKGGSTREAKKICKACDLREDCLEVSLDSQERYGIWGGLSERERRKLSKLVTSFMPQDIVVGSEG